MNTSKIIKILVTVLIVGGGIGYLVASSFGESMVYYKTVDDLCIHRIESSISHYVCRYHVIRICLVEPVKYGYGLQCALTPLHLHALVVSRWHWSGIHPLGYLRNVVVGDPIISQPQINQLEHQKP